MIISNSTPLNHIEIWQPRWSTRDILVAPWKVGTHNRITFKYAKSLTGDYYLSGATIKACELSSKGNGKAAMYIVPLDKIEPLERPEDIKKIVEDIFDE